ncbi:ABC-type nitrate/sulfonate/bicarbonate transport system permease component [Gaiella occulta]|uniref:ABC-type nitrate/sulfonate/bicarbonate transport system permease component n=1 Tax=Gaiella occulta TaxID=1002870 RepID=A0A7M2YVS5_9ACTN|nr:ABC transporter permease [Gaiella occulta]RDI74125.1 ABC-type nitrate/sulfonate/bicarbonate transport system permease component [Gaiella occulta]
MARRILTRLGITAAVLGGLWGLYTGYRWLWMTTGWTWPFVVDDLTMPPLHTIVSRLWQPAASDQPWLLRVLLEKAAFTAKEALVGFTLGAVVGFAIGVVFHFSNLLRRGFLPYVVGSQTVPILAIAPMVVIWLGGRGLPVWVPVAVIAAFLTFFPVAINTLRGLDAADPRKLELMRSYAASGWATLWRVKFPSALPYLFSALKVSATASVVGAIIGELPSSIQEGLGGAILTFNQYYSLDPSALWATNIVAAALGIVFFLAVLLVEKLVVRRAPENVA